MTACASGPPRPVEIESTDICERCKMALSEKQYAAELVERDGGVHKFDDIGCMIRFSVERGLKDKAAAWFVKDYESRGWLEARGAHFVKAEKIRSPMSGGLIALKERGKAGEYAGKSGGRVLTFDDLWK